MTIEIEVIFIEVIEIEVIEVIYQGDRGYRGAVANLYITIAAENRKPIPISRYFESDSRKNGTDLKN